MRFVFSSVFLQIINDFDIIMKIFHSICLFGERKKKKQNSYSSPFVCSFQKSERKKTIHNEVIVSYFGLTTVIKSVLQWFLFFIFLSFCLIWWKDDCNINSTIATKNILMVWSIWGSCWYDCCSHGKFFYLFFSLHILLAFSNRWLNK